jgi:hypothetical protein
MIEFCWKKRVTHVLINGKRSAAEIEYFLKYLRGNRVAVIPGAIAIAALSHPSLLHRNILCRACAHET